MRKFQGGRGNPNSDEDDSGDEDFEDAQGVEPEPAPSPEPQVVMATSVPQTEAELRGELARLHQKLKELSSQPVIHAELEPEPEPLKKGTKNKIKKKNKKIDSELDSELDPEIMEVIEKHIYSMAQAHDFETLSLKIIRDRLQGLIAKDITPYKQYIKSIVFKTIDEEEEHHPKAYSPGVYASMKRKKPKNTKKKRRPKNTKKHKKKKPKNTKKKK